MYNLNLWSYHNNLFYCLFILDVGPSQFVGPKLESRQDDLICQSGKLSRSIKVKIFFLVLGMLQVDFIFWQSWKLSRSIKAKIFYLRLGM